MSETPKIEESTVYESCLDLTGNDDILDVSRFMEDGLTQTIIPPELEEQFMTADERWKKHWKGMPTFDQNNNPPWKQIYLNFRNEEDYNEFAKLVNQNLSDKTKSIWYPKLDIEENSLHRWIVE